MNDDPSLRGAFTFEVHRSNDNGLQGAGAYAWMAAHRDGRIIPAIRMMPDSLLMDNTKMGEDVGQAGDLVGSSVRMIGADDNQISLAIHEIAHAAHYGELLKTVGIDPSASAKPALQQIIAQGENIGDTYIGARFAVDHGIDIDAKWDDIVKMYSDEKLRRTNFGYTTMSLEEKFGIYTTNTLHRFAIDSDSNALQNLSQFFYPKETSFREQEDIFHKALESVANNKVRLFGYKNDGVEGFNTVDEIRGVLEKALDGQTVEDFMEEGREALSGVLGFDSMRLQTKGQNFRDILETLGQSSDYAKTNVWESVAEGITLNKYTKHFPDANVIDDKIMDEMGRMAEIIVPQNSAIRSTIMTPEAKAWLKKLQTASKSIPTLPKEESTF
jgi:urease gamma subunit